MKDEININNINRLKIKCYSCGRFGLYIIFYIINLKIYIFLFIKKIYKGHTLINCDLLTF